MRRYGPESTRVTHWRSKLRKAVEKEGYGVNGMNDVADGLHCAPALLVLSFG